MKKFMLFIALLICVAVTEFFCLDANDTVIFRENTDVQQTDAITIVTKESTDTSADTAWEDSGTYQKVEIKKSDSSAEVSVSEGEVSENETASVEETSAGSGETKEEE